MSRKDIIIISVLINAGLLVILLISALTSKEETTALQPSVEVASSILEKNPEGMQTPLYDGNTEQKNDEKLAFQSVKEETPTPSVPNAIDEPTHPLPAVIDDNTNAVPEKIQAPTKPAKVISVKRNDTLEKIAKRNRTSVSKLKQLNHLKGNFLKIGQKIKIPTSLTMKEKATPLVGSPQAATTQVDADTLNMANALKDNENAQEEFYTVRVGDNLWTIAMKKHLKVSDLLSLNNLSAAKAKSLKPGDKIRIR